MIKTLVQHGNSAALIIDKANSGITWGYYGDSA